MRVTLLAAAGACGAAALLTSVPAAQASTPTTAHTAAGIRAAAVTHQFPGAGVSSTEAEAETLAIGVARTAEHAYEILSGATCTEQNVAVSAQQLAVEWVAEATITADCTS